MGGYWSTYWNNGYIYGTEIARGDGVFRLTPSEFLTQNEIDAANTVQLAEFNAQTQPHFVWPPSVVLGRGLAATHRDLATAMWWFVSRRRTGRREKRIGHVRHCRSRRRRSVP